MGCPPLRRDNSRALASGLLTVQEDLTCSMIPSVDLERYGVYCAKIKTCENCTRNLGKAPFLRNQPAYKEQFKIYCIFILNK